jgi:large subunit ribosomal protein L17
MAYSKLGRTSDQRKALLRDLVTDLIINERITTTESKAKELKKLADKMITLAKKGDLHARRQAAAVVRFEAADENQNALQKLFSEIGPRYTERNGGYTRIIKTVPRRGDGAPMAIIEFV